MTPEIGWYVHHHGRGHLVRAREIIAALDVPTTVFTSLDDDVPGAQELVHLPMDVAADPSPWDGVDRLHHAPLHVPGLTERVATMASWFVQRRPALFVVDVSAEVTVLARIAGIPPVVVRMQGTRDDPAHRTATDAAVSLLAPFPEWLEHTDTRREVRDATFYAGGMSRFDGRDVDRDEARARLGFQGDHVVVLNATGGDGFRHQEIHDAAAATDGWRWEVLGADGADRGGVRFHGWVEDVLPWLVAADVVVATAGSSSLMEVAAAGAPLVCIPRLRPFDEQRMTAEVLARRDVAVVRETWPDPDGWPRVLAQARARGSAQLSRLTDGRGAERAAAHLRHLAERHAPS